MFDAMEFVRDHAADEVLYAVSNPAYFDLKQDDVTELAAFVIEAIISARYKAEQE